MSQHTFANFTASARSGGDLSEILEAIQSGHIGTSKPPHVVDGMTWHKHLPNEGILGTVERYFTFDTTDFLEGIFDLDSGEYSSAGSGAGILLYRKSFTTSQTFSVPLAADINATSTSRVKMWGWGGGGSGATQSTSRGGGGGAYDEYHCQYEDLAASETVIIGAGGAAVTSNTQTGNDGGDTSIGTLLFARGGDGGASGGGDGGLSRLSVDNSGDPDAWSGGMGAEGSDPTDELIREFGAAGGGARRDIGTDNQAPTSVHGGNGGNGYDDQDAEDGQAPGGGGGGTNGGGHNSGAGARGEAWIEIYGESE